MERERKIEVRVGMEMKKKTRRKGGRRNDFRIQIGFSPMTCFIAV